MPDTSKCNVAAANFFAISNVANAPSIATCFARRRLVNGAESLNQLFNTLLLTIPGLVNIGMLLILLYFIFSVMAVQLFATAGFNGAYNQDANFRNFGTAFMTLLR